MSADETAPFRDRTGERLGRFVVEKMVADVGAGAAYEARDAEDGSRYVLELIPPEAVADPERRRLFLAEARGVAALRHPNLARFDVGECDDGAIFLATEAVSGATLRDVIDAAPDGMPLADAAYYATQIAQGLAAAHASGAVHRDLEPENVAVDDDGGAKIVGFGLARLLVPAAEEENGPISGTDLGTPPYMAPERATGAAVGPPADVFALGVITYEMLTGELPFEGKTPAEVAAAMARGAPPLRLPRAIEPIVRRCLAPDPAYRFPNGAAVAEALASVPIRAPRKKRRVPAWAIVTGIVVVVLAALVLGVGGPSQKAHRLSPSRGTAAIIDALRHGARGVPVPSASTGPIDPAF